MHEIGSSLLNEAEVKDSGTEKKGQRFSRPLERFSLGRNRHRFTSFKTHTKLFELGGDIVEESSEERKEIGTPMILRRECWR